MCVTDLDLDLEDQIAEDEQAPEPNPLPVGGQAPGAGNQVPGVAWG